MMKIPTLISVALALVAGILSSGIAPHVVLAEGPQPPPISFAAQKLEEENVEGPDVVRTYFTVGTKRIAYGVPKGCRLAMDGDGFVLSPTESGLAGVIRVNRSTFTPEFDLADNALKYREAVADKIPPGAIGLETLQPVINPYPYNGWKSLGFAWKFSFYGRSLQRTVSYINLDVGVQVIVTTESAQANAEKVNKMAQQFMGSWWVMNDGPKE